MSPICAKQPAGVEVERPLTIAPRGTFGAGSAIIDLPIQSLQ
jgi:hypothetical protein